MMNNIRLTLQYWKLKNRLMQEFGHDKDSAARTISALRKMSPEVLHMFLIWFRTGELPRVPIHEVYIHDIIETREMDPVSAFLAFDWVKDRPAPAKSFLGRPWDEVVIAESDRDELRQIAKRRKWDVRDQSAQEDTSDISDGIEPAFSKEPESVSKTKEELP